MKLEEFFAHFYMGFLTVGPIKTDISCMDYASIYKFYMCIKRKKNLLMKFIF